jgi:2,4-dienoyl-CoA reductase-like NADH-dependent reductase (Old Yellow Enzyme family)
LLVVFTGSWIDRYIDDIRFADRIRPHLTKAKLCVTGGFRTVEGFVVFCCRMTVTDSPSSMVRAIEQHSTDMIGLARPLTAEPHLCADLIHGRSTRAKPNYVDDFGSAASIIQMGEIGRGLVPSDLSDKDVARGISHRVDGAKEATPATAKA